MVFLTWQVREITGMTHQELDYAMTRHYIQPQEQKFRGMYVFSLEAVGAVVLARLLLSSVKVNRAWALATQAVQDKGVRQAVFQYIADRILGSTLPPWEYSAIDQWRRACLWGSPQTEQLHFEEISS